LVEAIEITKQMVIQAQEHERYRRSLRHQYPYTKFDTPDDAFIGKLGELSFEEYMSRQGLIKGIDFETQEGEIYDKWDYRLIKSNLTIDVKTAQTQLQPDDSWYFGYGIETKPENKDYIVICYVPKCLNDIPISQINFGQDWFTTLIMGYIEGSKVCNFEQVTHNTKVKFRYNIKAYDIPIRELRKDIGKLLKLKSNDLMIKGKQK
jgi:hypothetical protein